VTYSTFLIWLNIGQVNMKDGIKPTLPVEVWRLILLDAIASPLLPFSNRTNLRVGIVDCLDLFDTPCDSHKDYRRHQAMLTNLRLVCHSWATILDDYRNRCSFTDFRRVFLPKKSIKVLAMAERVHVRLRETNYCGSCDICRHLRNKKDSSDH
jgi:hypothetical protein